MLKSLGTFDVVHSWGVLHHTGDMQRALLNVVEPVKPGGELVLAIYNHHFTSPLWKQIKRGYNVMPPQLRPPLVYLMAGVIALAKFAVVRRNPFASTRGMDFMVDVVDWVGGYPYEYAYPRLIRSRLEPLGFIQRKLIPSETPTGCNEMVFTRRQENRHEVRIS